MRKSVVISKRAFLGQGCVRSTIDGSASGVGAYSIIGLLNVCLAVGLCERLDLMLRRSGRRLVCIERPLETLRGSIGRLLLVVVDGSLSCTSNASSRRRRLLNSWEGLASDAGED